MKLNRYHIIAFVISSITAILGSIEYNFSMTLSLSV